MSLVLKGDRVEKCLESCGSEFQMWGPKQEKVQKAMSYVCIVGFSACGCQEKCVVYKTEFKHIAVQRGKQDKNRIIIVLKDIQATFLCMAF